MHKYSIAVLFLFILFTNTYAQSVTASDDKDITERLNFIQNQMNEEKFYATFWTCGWTAFNGGSSAYFYYIAAKTNNKADKVTNNVIAIGSTIATIGNIVAPMVSMYAPYFLDDMPDRTYAEKAVKLKKAEDYLEDGSTLEVFGRSWIAHSINVVTSSAAAFIVGYEYRKTMKDYGKNPNREALIIFCECFLSGELQIWSQPMQLVSAEKEYNQRYHKSDNNENKVTFFVYPEFEENVQFTAGVASSF